MPPSDLSTTEILDRLDARDAKATAERQDQTAAFTGALRDQTAAFSSIVERESTLARGQLSQIVRLGAAGLALLVFAVLALAGVSVRYGGAAGTLELTPASAGAGTGLGSAAAEPTNLPVVPYYPDPSLTPTPEP